MKQGLGVKLMLIAAAAAVLLAGAVLLSTRLRPHAYAGDRLATPLPAYDFNLTGSDQKPYHLSDLRGRLVLLFFGFTSCPDECPTTTAILEQVLNQLGSRAGEVQVMMITVDPQTDTPQVLQAYFAKFGGRILGLTGDLAAISATARQYGVFYQKQTAADGSVSIQHTLLLELIDRQGNIRLTYPYNTPAELITADVAYLLNQ
jgi:protein SCO1/2